MSAAVPPLPSDSPALRRIAEIYPELSETYRRAAALVLRQPLEAATMSIVQLAEAAQISTATANRFVKALGFAGYAEFRAALVAALTSAAAPVERLRSAKAEGLGTPTIVRRTLEEDMANLEATLGGLTDAASERAVDLICRAGRIYTLGFGSSAYLAGFAAHRLQPFCEDVHGVSGEGGTEEAARRLFRAGAGDLILVFSFPRYSRDAVELALVGRERGAAVLSITDAPSSPLVPVSTLCLIAAATRRVLVTSHSAAIALVDALAAAAAQRREPALADYARLTEHVSPYLTPPEPRPASKERTPRQE
ncbi:transcriptional regulator [Aliidongia dinghuensis]|uniref:Transcriptional regulator n=1 Tax=Aliidongia dinghuensis TaxID=1867774 RepID=A0A8J2YZH3_9PROT|nr:MurR/RpiR family transcriptional regulator [Aliidongia dinghuensis]GGF46222.1 transcriptional regulator [Aliidongia dinghuensis]